MKSPFGIDAGSLDTGFTLDKMIDNTAGKLEEIGAAGMKSADFLQGAGGLIGGVANIFAGFEQSAVDRRNALTAQYNAEQTKIMGNIQRRMAMQEATKIMSKQAADRGASNLAMSGSALDVFMSSANEAFQDSANIIRATQVRSDAYEDQARQLYEKADSDVISGVVGGLTKLASSAFTMGVI